MCDITISGIRFQDPDFRRKQDLQFPIYESLIDYTEIGDLVRNSIQFEPAFQFKRNANEVCKFHLCLAQGDIVFARHPENSETPGEPAWVEVGGDAENPRSLILNVTLADQDRTCTIEVDPKGWSNGASSVVALRIFCMPVGGQGFDPYDGVSLTLIGGDDERQISDYATRCPVNEEPFTIQVVEIAGEVPTPRFAIFKMRDWPDFMSVEPAFRVSDRRPNLDLKIELPERYQFDDSMAAHGDDVALVRRGPSSVRPAELSRAVAHCPSKNSFQFSWRRQNDASIPPVSIYAPVQLIENGRVSSVGLRIDPTVITDPPPPTKRIFGKTIA